MTHLLFNSTQILFFLFPFRESVIYFWAMLFLC